MNAAYEQSKQILLAILILQMTFYFTVFLDIPIARQVIGFLYFTFFSGFIFVRLVKLKEVNWIETLLFSVGFSIAFLMFAGLLINELFHIFGVLQPLSLIYLALIFNCSILITGVLLYLKGESAKLFSIKPLLDPFALFFVCIAVLSIVGAIWVNVHGTNAILLFMIMTLSLLFIISCLHKKLTAVYPFAVLMIAIALLFHAALISNYFTTFGSDITGEYFVFKATESSLYWDPTNPYFANAQSNVGRLYSMLSITIFPTIYSSLLNIDSIWLFKLLFPLIFSLVPLGLYQIWQTYLNKKYAFIATFLLMAQETFYTEMLGLSRQMIAELFFVLLLLLITNKKIKSASKILFFSIFSFGLVVSHYGLAEIFLFFIFATAILSMILKRQNKKITIGMVLIFFVMMFSWYLFICGSNVFDSILRFGDYVINQIGNFFNPAARGGMVLRGLGLEAPPTIWNMISRVFAYLTETLIVVGFLGLITKRVKVPFELEYFILTMLSIAFLVALILVPGLAATMNMTRFYHVLLFFLAPLCVLGAETIITSISKRGQEWKVLALLLIVLVPYFLFQTSFIFEVTGSDSWSVPLSKYRMDTLKLYGKFGYTDAYCASGPYWLSSNLVVGHMQIYSDYYARNELRGYGLINPAYVETLSNVTRLKAKGVVYLSSTNVNENILVGSSFAWNLSEINFLSYLNKIYTNGESEVYENP